MRQTAYELATILHIVCDEVKIFEDSVYFKYHNVVTAELNLTDLKFRFATPRVVEDMHATVNEVAGYFGEEGRNQVLDLVNKLRES